MLSYMKYNAVKILLEGGASSEEVAQTLQVSEATVKLVKKCRSYEEYKQESNTLKYLAKKRKEAAEMTAKEPAPETAPTQIVEHRQSIIVQANHYMMEELKRQTELLKLISNKLAFVVDELTGIEKKEV